MVKISLRRWAVWSTVGTFATGLYAYRYYGQYYSISYYLTNSVWSFGVLANMFFVSVVLVGMCLKAVFLGSLRDSEVENAMERSKHAVVEVLFALTLFRHDLGGGSIAWIGLLLLVKIFHWLIQDRIEWMQHSVSISLGQHVRIYAAMLAFLALDIFLWGLSGTSLFRGGYTVFFVFGFEYAILVVLLVSSILKHTLHVVELRRSDGYLDAKILLLLWIDLFVDLYKLIVYFAFFVLIVNSAGIPLHLLRSIYVAWVSFRRRIRDIARYRRVVRDLTSKYPSVTAEDLASSDNICVVCRAEMNVGDGSKKLPCGHLFHAHCLRSWLGTRQNCPICDFDLLSTPPAHAAAPHQRQHMHHREPAHLPAAARNNDAARPHPPAAPGDSAHRRPRRHGSGSRTQKQKLDAVVDQIQVYLEELSTQQAQSAAAQRLELRTPTAPDLRQRQGGGVTPEIHRAITELQEQTLQIQHSLTNLRRRLIESYAQTPPVEEPKQ